MASLASSRKLKHSLSHSSSRQPKNRSNFYRVLTLLFGTACLYLVALTLKDSNGAEELHNTIRGAREDSNGPVQTVVNTFMKASSGLSSSLVEQQKLNSSVQESEEEGKDEKGSDEQESESHQSSFSKKDSGLTPSGWKSTGSAGEAKGSKESKPAIWNIEAKPEQKLFKKKKPVFHAGFKDEEGSTGVEIEPAPEQKATGPSKVPEDHPGFQGRDMPAPRSKEFGLWKNRHGIVHVLHSRFMQLQPDLIELGQARVELFKTFTLKSYHEQSTQEFLWLIFTDPKLSPKILDEMKALLDYDKNVLILGMNTEFRDFRDVKWMEKIEKVHHGDIQMLFDYHLVAQNHVFMETRIDMDDSFYHDFMRQVQGVVAQSLVKTASHYKYDLSKYASTPEFRVLCPEYHMEWGYFNPWDSSSTKGHLYGKHDEEFCISAGLTHAYQVGTGPLEIHAHHQLSKRYPQCPNLPEDKQTNCLDRVPDAGFKYTVIRSRTPTSAGMLGVIPKANVVNSKDWKDSQDEAWNSIPYKNFVITPQSLWRLREKLHGNMEAILTDALNGQCTRADFTCKDTSKKDLEKMLEEVKKHDSTAVKK